MKHTPLLSPLAAHLDAGRPALLVADAPRPLPRALRVLVGLAACLSGCDGETLEATPDPPPVPHAAPEESATAQELCVACHSCGSGGATVIDRTHSICTECHGPAPDFVVTPKGDGACGFEMDCSVVPPLANCATACHQHTVRQVNEMCEQCHAYAPCTSGSVAPCGTAAGECQPGEQRCVDGRWERCTEARGPVSEVCNGLDDDCDGATDEDFGVGQACRGGAGACVVEGVTRCRADGLSSVCDAPAVQPATEVCNGRDDDCDGSTDEELDCAARCPEGMAEVAGLFCMDRYEAARPDATAASAGADGSRATSRPGVLPWSAVTWAQADAACRAADKRLCSSDEWQRSCRGPAATQYCYGDSYLASACNGIDAFCPDESYPHCRDDQPTTPFHPVATGSFAGCTNEYGVFDLNGNLWEYDSAPAGQGHGGAYNCSNSEALHRCDHVAAWGTGPLPNFGFRCCRDPQ